MGVDRKMRVVLAGVSGSGKTTIGRSLAERCGVEFLDADDFHPPENRAKMAAGEPLDDEDRAGWLAILGRELAAREEAVLACSALKHSYRERLRELAGSDWQFVVLVLEPAEIRRRMEERSRDEGHFMPASLLDSQLAAQEVGDDVAVVENQGSVEEVTERVMERLV